MHLNELVPHSVQRDVTSLPLGPTGHTKHSLEINVLQLNTAVNDTFEINDKIYRIHV